MFVGKILSVPGKKAECKVKNVVTVKCIVYLSCWLQTYLRFVHTVFLKTIMMFFSKKWTIASFIMRGKKIYEMLLELSEG